MDIGEAVGHLLDCVPEYRPKHDEFLARWANWPGDVPWYSAVTCFGQEFLARMLESDAGNSDVLRRSLKAVEDLLLDGDELVVDAVYFGVIDYVYMLEARLAAYNPGALTQHEIKRVKISHGITDST